jgi:hypothetical protein
MPEPEFTAEEAVARFFPRSFDYDHVAAARLIQWLGRCGYVLVRKDAQIAPRAEKQETKTVAPVLVDA